MIKAVIFDCFGVLTTDGWLPFKQKYFGHDQKLLDEATELNRLANTNSINYGQFLSKMSEMTGLSSEQVQNEIENNSPNSELLDYVKTLKPKYKVGLLSNVSGDFLHELFSVEQLEPFDALALSHDIGAAKPDPRAYKAAAALVGAEEDQCVMIDDQPRLADGARRVGMKAIVYRNFEQMKRELEPLLAAVSNN